MALADDTSLVRAIAARIVGGDDADDVVQETFLRALVHPPATDQPLAPWLATVARHVAIDWLRRRRPTVDLDDLVGDDAPPPGRPGLPRLLAGLGHLSEGEVVVLLLRDALELSVDEVAAAMDTSAGTVRVLHHRARRKAAAADRADDRSLQALERFLTWLLARATVGLPVRARLGDGPDPAFAAGTLAAHAALLDGMVEAAAASGRPELEARARLARGTARIHTSPAASLPDFRAAVALSPEPAIPRLRLASQLYHLGRRDEARREAEAGLTEEPERVRGLLHQFLARVCLDADDREGARRHAAAARAVPGVTGAAAAAVTAGVVLLAEERFAEARVEFAAALALVRSRGNVHDEPAMLNNLAIATLGTGDLDEAERLATSAFRLARSRDDRRREAQIQGVLALVALHRGRTGEAVTAFERTVEASRSVGLGAEVQLARTFLGVLEHLRGRPARAAELLRAVVEDTRSAATGETHRTARAWLLAAEVALGTAPPGGFDALRAEARAAGQRGLLASLDLLEALADPALAQARLAAADERSTPVRVAALLLRAAISGS
jgi:DNA-directed RNA polymerase specialized sigma24 family protein